MYRRFQLIRDTWLLICDIWLSPNFAGQLRSNVWLFIRNIWANKSRHMSVKCKPVGHPLTARCSESWHYYCYLIPDSECIPFCMFSMLGHPHLASHLTNTLLAVASLITNTFLSGVFFTVRQFLDRKPKLTLSLTQGILSFPHQMDVVWEQLTFGVTVRYAAVDIQTGWADGIKNWTINLRRLTQKKV